MTVDECIEVAEKNLDSKGRRTDGTARPLTVAEVVARKLDLRDAIRWLR